ncbi:MAG: GNAT family N-acetyltransferase [Methanobacteriota archaeon]|nr:MAG: GNAT family N-acetyltransferase [Euryarchaeota archaeon]
MDSRGSGRGVMLLPLQEDDIPKVLALWSEAGLPTKPGGRDTLENLTRRRREAPDLFIGAFEGERMIGVVIGSDDGRKGWVNRLAVVPDRRRAGIAAKLLARCEEALRSRGRRIICALIEKDNEASQRLVEGKGYRCEDRIAYYAKREADDV